MEAFENDRIQIHYARNVSILDTIPLGVSARSMHSNEDQCPYGYRHEPPKQKSVHWTCYSRRNLAKEILCGGLDIYVLYSCHHHLKYIYLVTINQVIPRV
jgi:hypothetical protein